MPNGKQTVCRKLNARLEVLMDADGLTVQVKLEIDSSALEKLHQLELLITKAKGSLNNSGDLLTLRVHKADRFLVEAWNLLNDIFTMSRKDAATNNNQHHSV
jgi:hypothetical protein